MRNLTCPGDKHPVLLAFSPAHLCTVHAFHKMVPYARGHVQHPECMGSLVVLVKLLCCGLETSQSIERVGD